MSKINISPSTSSKSTEDEPSQSECLRQAASRALETSDNSFDKELAQLRLDAVRMANRRELLIQQLLSSETFVQEKQRIRVELNELSYQGANIIENCIGNRLKKNNVNIAKLFSMRPAIGYFHYIQGGGHYPTRLNDEEKLRALEPSTEVRINTKDPELYSILLKSISEVAVLLEQYSILITTLTHEDEFIVDRTVVLKAGSIDSIPIIKTFEHSFGINDIFPYDDFIKAGLTDRIVSDFFNEIKWESVVSEELAKHGIAGGTFIDKIADLIYIRPYDPDKRPYESWIQEVVRVLQEVSRNISISLLQKANSLGVSCEVKAEELNKPVNIMQQIKLIVVDQGGFSQRFLNYTVLTGDSEDSVAARTKIYNYMIHGIIN